MEHKNNENAYQVETWPVEDQADGFRKLAGMCYDRNFGRMSKGDLEVLLFSIYIEHLLQNGADYDDYTLAVKLGIPEARVRNLKIKKELQYPYSDYDWKRAFVMRLPYAKYDDKKALVKVSIPDPNVRRDVEHYIDSRNWYSEYQLNAKLLQMRADQFIEMCTALYSELSLETGFTEAQQKQIEEKLKKTSSSVWMDNRGFDIITKIGKEGFNNCWRDIAKEGTKVGLKILLSAIPFSSAIQSSIDKFIDNV